MTTMTTLDSVPQDCSAPHFGALIGLEHRSMPEGQSCLHLPLSQMLCNRMGIAHGGVVLTLLDVAGSWAGCEPQAEAPRAVTVSLNCNFLRAARLPEVHALRAQAQVVKSGRSLYYTSMEVFAEPSGQLLANAQGVYSILK